MATVAAPQSAKILDRVFRISEHGSTAGREIVAGLTTFMVMSYIIFVNPVVLGFVGIKGLDGKGLPFAAVLTSTCLVAGLMTIAMGIYTNRAFAIASGMGLNAVVAFQLVAGMGLSWPAAMGVVVLEGIAITLLVLVGLRQAVMEAIPLALKQSIAVGIGLFILFIGLVNAGIVVPGPEGVPVTLGKFLGVPIVVALIGLALTIYLVSRNVPGAILIGILISTAVATGLNYATGLTAFTTPGVAQLPSSIVAAPDLSILGQFDFSVFTVVGVIPAILVVFSLMLSDFFDTMGTLIGVGGQAGYLTPKGELPEINKPLLIDSLAAVAGGAASASSATTYIESAAGIGAGGRTGLVAVVVGLCFLLAMPFSPIIGMVPKEATAPALIIVGYLMTTVLTTAQAGTSQEGLRFDRFDVGLPAVMTIVMMPLTYSITNGIGAGFITYTLIQIFVGKAQRLHWMMYVISAAFVVYFAQDWIRAAFGV